MSHLELDHTNHSYQNITYMFCKIMGDPVDTIVIERAICFEKFNWKGKPGEM
jgi:hypothetical protein